MFQTILQDFKKIYKRYKKNCFRSVIPIPVIPT